MKRLWLLTLVLACLVISANAETILVGEEEGMVPSLTQAIEQAADGDTILMASGVYDESRETFPIMVDKAVTISPQEGAVPVIVSPKQTTAMEITGAGATVSGLKFDHIRCAIWVLADDVTVKDCVITLVDETWRTSSSGMWIAGAKRTTLTGCTFTGCSVSVAGPPISDKSVGIPVLTAMFEVGEDIEFFTTHTMTDNLVNGLPLAYVVDLDGAVYSEPCGQLIAVSCDDTTFTALECGKASMGIELLYCTDSMVENCTADDAGIFGIYVAKSEDCILRSCRADRGAHGIDLRAIHRCIVEGCSATGGGQGMFFSMAFDSMLVNCDIIENGTGFYAAAGDRNHMDNCRIQGNQLGIYIQKEPNFTVTTSLFRANWNTGARSSQAPGFAIIGCTFEDNWVAAMSNYSDGVFYYSNSFAASQSCSLYMKGNTQVRMLNNVFTDEDQALVQIADCPDILRWPKN